VKKKCGVVVTMPPYQAFSCDSLTLEQAKKLAKRVGIRTTKTKGSKKYVPKDLSEICADLRRHHASQKKGTSDPAEYILAPNESRCRVGYRQIPRRSGRCVNQTLYVTPKEASSSHHGSLVMKNLKAAVESRHKYFVLAHGESVRRVMKLPPGVFIVFMTTPGAITLNPVVSQLLMTEQSARSLIAKEHPRVYSVTYFPGDDVPDVELSFPLREQGRGVWKVPLKESFTCEHRDNPTPNNTGYMTRARTTLKQSSLQTTLTDLVQQFVAEKHVAFNDDKPLVLFIGSCRYTNDTDIYEYCARHNKAACERMKKALPNMNLRQSQRYGLKPYENYLEEEIHYLEEKLRSLYPDFQVF
jgi:hypothetical protein